MRDASSSYKRIMAGPIGNDDNRQDSLKKTRCRQRENRQGGGNFFADHASVSCFWGRYPAFLKIRQIHNIFIPLWFHWIEIVLRISYGTGLQEILLF